MSRRALAFHTEDRSMDSDSDNAVCGLEAREETVSGEEDGENAPGARFAEAVHALQARRREEEREHLFEAYTNKPSDDHGKTVFF